LPEHRRCTATATTNRFCLHSDHHRTRRAKHHRHHHHRTPSPRRKRPLRQRLSPRDQPLITNSVVDLLRQDPSLNLQARAGNGVQADLSLRGTTFEQSLILLNGLRINDPETGHLNLDIPVPLDAVTRIDILHGSGSTFYGSDAIGGAVNLLTQPPAPGLTVIASAGGGNYAFIEQHLRASYTNGLVAEQLTGSRDTSDGFIPDRNYSSNRPSNQTMKLLVGLRCKEHSARPVWRRY
jgi:outer membrane receptor protein involved in Fe transport